MLNVGNLWVILLVSRGYVVILVGFLIGKYLPVAGQIKEQVNNLVGQVLLPMFFFARVGVYMTFDTLDTLVLSFIDCALYYAACNVVAGVFAKVFDCPQGFQNISKAFVMIGTHILVPVVIGFGACGSDKFFLGNPHCGEITTYIFFFNLFGNIFIFAMGADYYQKDAAMKGASNTVNLPNYTELRENEYSGQETLLASQPPPPRVTTQYIIQNVLDRPMIASLVAAFLTLIPGLKGLLFAPGSPGGYFVGVIGEIGDFSADLTLLTAGIGVAEVLAENNMRFIIPKQYLYQLTIVKLIAVPLIGLLTLRFQKKHIGLSFKKDPVFQWTHMLMWMAPASGQNIAFAEENNYVKSEMKTLWMLQVICSIFSMSFVGILFFKYY